MWVLLTLVTRLQYTHHVRYYACNLAKQAGTATKRNNQKTHKCRADELHPSSWAFLLPTRFLAGSQIVPTPPPEGECAEILGGCLGLTRVFLGAAAQNII
jgi:hypothetical protein